MIRLKVHKQLTHLSPTSYRVARACPYSLYLNKLTEMPVQREPATRQMQMGTAFDAFVKAEICNILEIDDPKKNFAELIQGVKDKDILETASAVFDFYNFYGCVKELIDCGIEDIETDIRSEDLKYVAHGFPDVILRPNERWFPGVKTKVPHDFKVSGFESSRANSPKPGYLTYRINQPGLKFSDKGKHARYGEPLDELYEDWALQLIKYNWMINGYIEGETYGASIDHICLQPDGRIGVAQIRTTISPKYSDELYKKVVETWNLFTPDEEGMIEIPDPVPSTQTCEPYNRPRTCTSECSYYKSLNSDPLISQALRN